MKKCSDLHHRQVCGSDKFCRNCGIDFHLNCPECKNWPQRWKELVKEKKIIPGAIYKNKHNFLYWQNVRKPYGHMIGATDFFNKNIEHYTGIINGDKHWERLLFKEVIRLYFSKFMFNFKKLLK